METSPTDKARPPLRAARQLMHLLRGQWFRRLFAVRVASQFSDGVFQVALASYVIFSPQQQPSPTAIAAALATVLLPFSVLGPFAGVDLDLAAAVPRRPEHQRGALPVQAYGDREIPTSQVR